MADIQLLAPDGKPFIPTSDQVRFFGSPARYRAFLGGIGTGKTLTNAIECLMAMLRHPGTVGLLGRWSYKELVHTTWDTLLSITPKQLIKEQKKAPNLELVLINGSKLLGWNLSNWGNLTSLNLGFAAIDEVTEIEDPAVYHQLQMRLRHPAGPHRMWVSGTPNGRDWLFRTYVSEKRPDHELINPRTRDNPHLPAGYENELRKLFSAEMVQRFLDGKFTGVDGLVLYSFSEELHGVEPFDLPAHWPRFRAIDPGHRDPAACLWGATNEAGDLFLYDGYYETGKIISEQSAEILRKTGETPIAWTVIDPSAGQTSDAVGKSRLELYRESGISTLYPGNNDIHASIAQLLELLQIDPEHTHPISGEKGSPRLFVFKTPALQPLFDELSHWKWNPRGGGGPKGARPVDKDDHAISALRYLVMHNPDAAPSIAPAPEINASWQRFHAILADLDGDLGPRLPSPLGSDGIAWSR